MVALFHRIDELQPIFVRADPNGLAFDPIAQGSWEPRGVATDGDLVYVSARRSGSVLVFAL